MIDARMLQLVVALLVGVGVFFALQKWCQKAADALKKVTFSKARLNCSNSKVAKTFSGLCAVLVASCLMAVLRSLF